jgi:heat-inducible transcriptional repressor
MLTPREHQILRALVNEYSASAQPVGSRLLWSRYGFGISPATIRSVMVALTEAGFLSQPHTSAGRIPTDRAYRLFLESTEASAPSVGEQEKVVQRIKKAGSPAEAGRALARMLSEVAGAASVYASADGVEHFNLANVFGQPEFRDPRVAAYLAEVLDQAAEWLPKLADKPGKIALRIGQEHEDFRAQQVSVVAIRLPGTDGYVAVIGPARMPYRKLTSLCEHAVAVMEKTYGQT